MHSARAATTLLLAALALGQTGALAQLEYTGGTPAFDYVGSGDYAGSIPIWTALAWKGDTQSQVWLGLAYLNGWSVERNYPVAYRWLSLAADQGNTKARLLLGVMNMKGLGVSKNYAMALECFNSIGGRSADALNNLGYMYSKGYGVKRDLSKAIAFYRRAADGGCASARYSLGEMYRQGVGLDRDDQQALQLFRDAAKQREAHAMYCLAVMHAQGAGVEPDEAEARKWFLAAQPQLVQLSHGGDQEAAAMVGSMRTEYKSYLVKPVVKTQDTKNL